MEKIDHLSRVRLSIRSIDSKNVSVDITPKKMSFILGSGSKGLCPFEIMLSGMRVNDSFTLNLHQNEMMKSFGHLYKNFIQAMDVKILPLSMVLKFTVTAIEEASQQEIVKAIAGSLGSGCGSGSCDCGCG